MVVVDSGTDPEPDILHVPVFTCSADIVTIRTGRLSSGEQVGLGFTSAASLAVAFGPGQAWVLIHLRLLHEMLASRGIFTVQVDPVACHPPRQASTSRAAGRHGAGRHVTVSGQAIRPISGQAIRPTPEIMGAGKA
jgi:hypothetical protein